MWQKFAISARHNDAQLWAMRLMCFSPDALRHISKGRGLARFISRLVPAKSVSLQARGSSTQGEI